MDFISTKNFKLATISKGDKNSKKLALVLPGKLDTKDYSHMVSHVEYLSKLGFFALSFDPPGTWESPGDISIYNTTNYLKAVDELIEYLGNKPTFVMGHSRGGSMAMLSGISNSHVVSYAAIMSFAYKRGFDDKRTKVWKNKKFTISMRDLPPGGGPKSKRFEIPYSFLKDQIKYDVTEGLKKSTKPKLFAFGNIDVVVPPNFIKDAYNMASEPKELYEFNSIHDYRLSIKSIDEVNKMIGDFLNKYKIV